MSLQQIATVRQFNRMVSQRAGALEDHFLGRDRPLGQSRVLFEIGAEGATLRALRMALGLDSGYLSRLVHALVAEGLVALEPGTSDERLRVARLTDAGVAEVEEIDRRSDETAHGVLEPLTAEQRARLVEAMAIVHRLLRLAAVRFQRVDPASPEARWCLARYFEELDARFDAGFDPDLSLAGDHSEFASPEGSFIVAEADGRSIACGAVKRDRPGVAYIKRMWVDDSLRGLGLGRRMLGELEADAVRLGCSTVRLETNRALQEAIRLYGSSGYRPVEAFNDEHYAHHWFEKTLGADR